MDRPISAARWSTRETERKRRRDRERIFSTYGMVRAVDDEKRERGRATERERSWSGRSPANRRTRGGPVRCGGRTRETLPRLFSTAITYRRLLCNLLSSGNEFSSARPMVVIELPRRRPMKSQLARISASLRQSRTPSARATFAPFRLILFIAAAISRTSRRSRLPFINPRRALIKARRDSNETISQFPRRNARSHLEERLSRGELPHLPPTR